MANHHYQRGHMNITAQKTTFREFMDWVVYGGSAVAIILLYPILVFCAHIAWPYALLATIIVGLLLGRGLKLSTTWYALVISLGILVGIICSIWAALV